MNFTNDCMSTLTQTNENLLLRLTNVTSYFAQKWMFAPLLFLVFQSWALPVSIDQLSYAYATSTIAIDNTTSTKSDTTYKPAPKYGLSEEEFTAKGINRTAADFENFYLQVVAANNKPAIDDEVTVFKTYISTHLGKREDNTPWKVFIGPFPTRAAAKIYKINHSIMVPEDAFPCPAYMVEPIIIRSFWKD